MNSNPAASHEMTRASQEAGSSRTPTPEVRRICLVVLGMHRSGTSAFARVASLLGCELPRDLMGGSEGNSLGHWESNAVVTLNDQLLASAGSRWDDWLPLNPAWSDSLMYASFLQRAVITLEQEYGDSPLCILKDPRVCRIADFWIEAIATFGANVIIAIPVRNPFEVANSLSMRDGSKPGHGLLLWLSHVLDAERMSRGKPRHIFGYKQMLRDWRSVSEAIEQKTGLVWPRKTISTEAEIDDFLIPDERHQKVSNDQALGHRSPPWVRQTYAILDKWCKEGEDSADYTELDRIRSEFHMAAPTFAQLVIQGMGVGEGAGEGERQRQHLEAEVARLTQQIAKAAENPALDTDFQDGGRIAVLTEEREGLLARLQALEEYSEHLKIQLEGASAQSETQALVVQLKDERDALVARQEELGKQLENVVSKESEAIALGQQVADLEGQIMQLSSALRQREEEATQAWMELATEKRAHESLHEERDALLAQQEELGRQLKNMVGKESEAIALGQQVAGLEGQIMQLSSALRQREEEATQAWMELATEKRAHEFLHEEIARSEMQGKALEERISVLEDSLNTRTQALLVSETQGLESRWEAKEAAWRLELASTTLERNEEQIGRLQVEQAEALVRVARYEAELVQFQMQLEQDLQRHTGQDELLAHREAELESTRAEHRDVLAKVARYEQEVSELVRAQMQLETLLSETQASHAALVDIEESRKTERDSTAERINQQHAEIAQLTRIAMSEAETAREMRSRAEWLQAFNAAQKSVPRWWALLPANRREARFVEKIEKMGLFDSSAYNARHDDVVQSGMGALDHYIRYGIFEGRSW